MTTYKWEQVLTFVEEMGGLVTTRQLSQQLWPEAKSERSMLEVLQRNHENGLIQRPSAESYRQFKIPEPFLWLTLDGILFVAANRYGIHLDKPARITQKWLRQTKSQLREAGLSWREKPGWNTLEHSFAVVDFRLRVKRDVAALSDLEIEQAFAEHLFRSDADTVKYRYPNDNSGDVEEKEVQPDDFFILVYHHRARDGKKARLHLPVEIDRATHEVGNFGRKAVAGAKWLTSDAYRQRFDHAVGGVWLVVTTGGKRLDNIMAETAQQGVSANHLYTTFPAIDEAENIFTDPIWQMAGADAPLALYPLDHLEA